MFLNIYLSSPDLYTLHAQNLFIHRFTTTQHLFKSTGFTSDPEFTFKARVLLEQCWKPGIARNWWITAFTSRGLFPEVIFICRLLEVPGNKEGNMIKFWNRKINCGAEGWALEGFFFKSRFTLDLIPLNLKLRWFTLTKYITYMKLLRYFWLITPLGRIYYLNCP